MRACRSLRVLLVAVAMTAPACGDDGGLVLSGGNDEASTFPPTSTSSAAGSGETVTTADTTTSAAGASSTSASTTAPPPPTTATTAGGTTATEEAPPPPPTALDTLAAFFAAADDLNRQVRDAAAVFNAGFDEGAASIDPGVGPVVDALDTYPLRALVPGGMSSELETAVLAVFADLDSRIAALHGGVFALEAASDVDWALDCLANGGRSFDRYADDVARARDLAAREPSPNAAADSEAAGIVAVRLEAIHSMNWGCESCGGVEYDAPFEVDWPGRTIIGVEFEATYTASGWEILIYAC
jgi:hypothetical protein